MHKRYIFVALIVSVFTLASCSDKENTEVDQYDKFSAYLKSNYSGDEYYYDSISRKMFRLFVYRKTGEGSESLQTVESGDSVYLDFMMSGFSSSDGAKNVYFTNIPGVIATDTILNKKYWPTDTKGVELGRTPLVKGLELGLPGCKENDTVMFFLPSTLNYGDKQVGMVPPDEPVVWTLIINKVTK